mmetsp:Transcript_98151/g.274786  ORF Transcript_98151/g.274786 Transcript_98151/m.274786 type:complete len:200 (-) Transcript_98151:133-732(-)
MASLMLETTVSNMPVTTAVYDTSMTNMKTGGCGGRTMYSPGAMYSTAPLCNSCLWYRSTRLPVSSRLLTYESVVVCDSPHRLHRHRRPLDSQWTKGLTYVRQLLHLTIVPTLAKFTGGTSSISGGSGASGWSTMPRGMLHFAFTLAELGGLETVLRTKCAGELAISSSFNNAVWSCPWPPAPGIEPIPPCPPIPPSAGG